MRGSAIDLLQGLSPRVRGSPADQDCAFVSIGSIPACAGEPRGPRLRHSWRKVYPRVCGGAGDMARWQVISKGLSPRVRGSRARPWRRPSGSRSIPACAGEPVVGHLGPPLVRVYPRVCGGATDIDADDVGAYGLSPRVRGSPAGTCAAGAGFGSIPACAGEPRPWGWRRSPGAVYPRVCGGAFGAGSEGRPDLGLSPRVRGSPRWP